MYIHIYFPLFYGRRRQGKGYAVTHTSSFPFLPLPHSLLCLASPPSVYIKKGVKKRTSTRRCHDIKGDADKETPNLGPNIDGRVNDCLGEGKKRDERQKLSLAHGETRKVRGERVRTVLSV